MESGRIADVSVYSEFDSTFIRRPQQCSHFSTNQYRKQLIAMRSVREKLRHEASKIYLIATVIVAVATSVVAVFRPRGTFTSLQYGTWKIAEDVVGFIAILCLLSAYIIFHRAERCTNQSTRITVKLGFALNALLVGYYILMLMNKL